MSTGMSFTAARAAVSSGGIWSYFASSASARARSPAGGATGEPQIAVPQTEVRCLSRPWEAVHNGFVDAYHSMPIDFSPRTASRFSSFMACLRSSIWWDRAISKLTDKDRANPSSPGNRDAL